MCSPTLIFTGLSIASSFIGQRQEAKAQERANAIERQNIEERYRLDAEALANQQQEAAEVATADKAEAAREAAVLRAQIRVSQSESGTAGLTTARLLRDVDFAAGIQFRQADTAQERQARQSRLELKAADLNRRSRHGSIKQPKKPSIASAGLQFGSALVNAPAGSFDSLKIGTKPTAQQLSGPF